MHFLFVLFLFTLLSFTLLSFTLFNVCAGNPVDVGFSPFSGPDNYVFSTETLWLWFFRPGNEIGKSVFIFDFFAVFSGCFG